ncbi:hypothetical protein DPMN_039138 [Dreissena polymorpha]|uniref:Uncharacterized protein n=1 Tax=Dreissena polymorpha TaxID=45954 RepID=A0A9D4MG01_DREPO|nr:hypothetical protein DPMN_039138 [Dreissena polymorpha]
MPQVIRHAERLPVAASSEVLRPIVTEDLGSNNEMHVLCRCVIHPGLYKALKAPNDHAALCLTPIEPSTCCVQISHCSGVLYHTHQHTTHLL